MINQHNIHSDNDNEHKSESTPLTLTAYSREKLQHQTEITYQQYLHAKAIKNIIYPTRYRFDPQGHVLTEVTLDDSDYKEIIASALASCGELTPADKREFRKLRAKECLEKLLNETKPLSLTTICNIDIKDDPLLKKEFKSWLSDVPNNHSLQFSQLSFAQWLKLNNPLYSENAKNMIRQTARQAYSEQLNNAADCLLSADQYLYEGSSINALQEEMEMHLNLALHVFKKAFDKVFPIDKANEPDAGHALWDTIFKTAATDLNKKVKTIYQKALTDSYDGTTINFDHLNKILDKSRHALADYSYDQLIEKCQSTIPNFHSLCELPAIKKLINKKIFKTTTASANDYFSHDILGINTRISGSGNTSHHKNPGIGQQAIRLSMHSDGSVGLRIPSIPNMDKKSITADQHQADTTAKIKECVAIYRPKLALNAGPIILHRETSLPQWYKDTNAQVKRVAIELKAVHQYNTCKNPHEEYFFMQNIAVNQHTQDLSYKNSGTIKEATLMAEIALLNTLSRSLNRPELSGTYQRIMRQYENFLKNNRANAHAIFSESAEGKITISELDTLKLTLLAMPIQAQETDNLKTLATQALFKLFIHDLHRDARFGTLMQSLSCFCSSAPAAGCKSANERYAIVEERTTLLRALNLDNCKIIDSKAELNHSLTEFINAPTKMASDLEKTLSSLHNKHTSQIRSGAVISSLDQGAANKIATFVKGIVGRLFNWNTNRAESADVTRLHADGISAMQAHKGDHAKVLKHKIKASAQDPLLLNAVSPFYDLLGKIDREIQRTKDNCFILYFNKSAKAKIEILKKLKIDIQNPYLDMSKTNELAEKFNHQFNAISASMSHERAPLIDRPPSTTISTTCASMHKPNYYNNKTYDYLNRLANLDVLPCVL